VSQQLPADQQCHGCWGATTGVVATVDVLGVDLRFCGSCLFDANQAFGPLEPTFIGRYADFNEEVWNKSDKSEPVKSRGQAAKWPLMIGRG
jgi:hypothetical protein